MARRKQTVTKNQAKNQDSASPVPSRTGADGITGAQVADYLRAHPDFLTIHTDLLRTLIPPHRPLAQGFLTGKYTRGDAPPQGTRLALQETVRRKRETAENWTAVEAVVSLAEEKACTPAQIATAWLLTRPQVTTVIAGASTPEQVRDNTKAVDVLLTPEDLDVLDKSLPTIPGGAVGAVELREQLRGDKDPSNRREPRRSP